MLGDILKSRFFTCLFLLFLLVQIGFSFNVEILNVESPVKGGRFLDIDYALRGMENISGDVTLEYWLEKDGEVIISGSDTIYIEAFEEKTRTTSLYVYNDILPGAYTVHIRLSIYNYVTEAYRPIEIISSKLSVVVLSLEEFDVQSDGLLFSALLTVNKDEPVKISFSERITAEDGEEIVDDHYDVVVNTSKTIYDDISLYPGVYQLELTATYENETTKIIKTFEIAGSETGVDYISYLPYVAGVLVILFLVYVFLPKKTGKISR